MSAQTPKGPVALAAELHIELLHCVPGVLLRPEHAVGDAVEHGTEGEKGGFEFFGVHGLGFRLNTLCEGALLFYG